LKNPPDENLRSSYVLWDEKVIPQFALEIVSKSPGREYTDKFKIYQSFAQRLLGRIGILYYLVYSPLRKRKARFQLYQLIDGKYVLQSDGSKPYWMPEVGLGIGAQEQIYGGNQREWLYWYDENDVRYPTPMERADIEAAARTEAEQRANNAQQENDVLRQRLRELGVDPDALK
jgi:Putative restriction endonuclease